MAGMDNLDPDAIQGPQKSRTVTALLSPRLEAKFLKIEPRHKSCDNDAMLLKFAESIEKCLINSQDRLFNSPDTGYVTKRSFSCNEMMVKENMYEFKETLRRIRSSHQSPALHSSYPNGSTHDLQYSETQGTDNQSRGTIAACEEKMKPWIELTKVEVEPKLPPRRQTTSVNQRDKHLWKRLSIFSLSNLVTPATADSRKVPNVEYICFTFQFLIMTERLKVTVKSASNLFKNTENYNEANSFAEVCLVPGKVQMQTSELVKRSKNPLFKSVFYFRGFSLQEMHHMNLRIRLMGKQHLLSRPKIIGEVVVSLENFDLVSENLLDEQLHTRIVPAKSGSIRHVLLKYDS